MTVSALPPATSSETTVRVGVALMAVATLSISGIDAIAKMLAEQGVPPLQATWARFTVQMLILAPMVFFVLGPAGFWPKRPGLTALRGILITLATFFFFTALQFMSMAETVAVFFVEPLILTILSAVVLREAIGWRRITAVTVGFCGAMLIIQPNFALIGWPALLPLACALCFAFYLLLTKILTAEEHALTLHLWAGWVGCVAVSASLALGAAFDAPAFTPVWPTSAQWGWLFLLGAGAAACHFLLVMAFRRAPASQLAPLTYLEIVSATALGYLIFGEVPNASTWFGVALVVGSGLFVLQRERRRRTGTFEP